MTDEPNEPQHDKFHTDNTNEVVDFIDKVKAGWMRWGDWLLAAMLIASASWFAYNYYTGHKNTEREEAYRDLAGSDSPEVLAAISQKATYSTIAPQAALRAADLFLKKAQVEADAAKSKEALNKAEGLYQRVADNAALPLAFRANALLGLASVAETKGNWENAEADYKKVADQTDETLPNLADLAKARLALLPALKVPVVFGAEPIALPTPAIVPAEDTAAPPALPLTTPEVPATTAPATPPAPAAPKGLEAPLK